MVSILTTFVTRNNCLVCWNLQTFSTEVTSGDILWYLSPLDELLHRRAAVAKVRRGVKEARR